MRHKAKLGLTLLPGLLAQPSVGQSPAQAIQAVLKRQVDDWNRGNIDSFAAGYKNAPDILFIGKSVEQGYAAMVIAYKKHYPTRASMGTLTFSQLAVQPLDAKFATATGHFHLQRTAEGGGSKDGHFLLVLENTSAGWKIVRDDTTEETTPDTAAASKRLK